MAKAVEAATADIIARIASLEDTVLTLAEALLRPAIRAPQPSTRHITAGAKQIKSRIIPNGSG